MKKLAYFALTLLLLVVSEGCRRQESAPSDPAITESDQRKLKAYLDKMSAVTTLKDLPPRYHARQIPDASKGIAFEVYLDEKLLKSVRADEFTCPEEEQLVSRKGPKSHTNCPLIPFLQRLVGSKITYMDLVGEQRDFEIERFIPNELEENNLELAAFLAPRGQVRIEERSKGSMMTVAEAEQRGLHEGRKGGKGMGRKKGVMRGRFKTRSLYWVDVYTTPLPQEVPVIQPEQPVRRRLIPSTHGAVVIAIPGKGQRELSPADVVKCGEAGCPVKELLSEGGNVPLWCIGFDGGVTVRNGDSLTHYLLRIRRQTGEELVLHDPSNESLTIRKPYSIAPCTSPQETGPKR